MAKTRTGKKLKLDSSRFGSREGDLKPIAKMKGSVSPDETLSQFEDPNAKWQQNGQDWTKGMYDRLQGANTVARAGGEIAGFAGGAVAGGLAGEALGAASGSSPLLSMLGRGAGRARDFLGSVFGTNDAAVARFAQQELGQGLRTGAGRLPAAGQFSDFGQPEGSFPDQSINAAGEIGSAEANPTQGASDPASVPSGQGIPDKLSKTSNMRPPPMAGFDTGGGNPGLAQPSSGGADMGMRSQGNGMPGTWVQPGQMPEGMPPSSLSQYGAKPGYDVTGTTQPGMPGGLGGNSGATQMGGSPMAPPQTQQMAMQQSPLVQQLAQDPQMFYQQFNSLPDNVKYAAMMAILAGGLTGATQAGGQQQQMQPPAASQPKAVQRPQVTQRSTPDTPQGNESGG